MKKNEVESLRLEMNAWFYSLFAFVGILGYYLTETWWTLTIGSLSVIAFFYIRFKYMKGGTQKNAKEN